MTRQRKDVGGLSVDSEFLRFVNSELLPAVGVDIAAFWRGTESIINAMTADNRRLLERRDALQAQIDDYHDKHKGRDHNAYVSFLKDIGYLAEPGDDFSIGTTNVDREIASIAGPQLVVPVSNARFALNAANARWGSLYDALYGTDAIDEGEGRTRKGDYNPVRGGAVIARAAAFLDDAIPLDGASHTEVTGYRIDRSASPPQFLATLANGSESPLRDPRQCIGLSDDQKASNFLFLHHGLHIEIQVNPEHPIGREAKAHVADILLESAVTTIQDCEDSVAAVDAADKTHVYRNWFGLMQGTLEARVAKSGGHIDRRLNPDRDYKSLDGRRFTLPGRSLMLVRNVGHLMQTDAILDAQGEEVFEGILDAIMTVGAALNDIHGRNALRNSRCGSVYIVKPKMHGPEEAAFCDRLMAAVEDLYGLARHTVKVGVMDEERRTTVNLGECIRAVRDRLVFINTGFLDRTGDEIHTSMRAGPMLRKEAIKAEPWIRAYEDWNVDVGLRCGLQGKAQIGKGMFPKTDEMREMLETKQAHVLAGANCAWVPSPTAATLHAMHYHDVDVFARQRELAKRPMASLDDILTPPMGDPSGLSRDAIQQELDNNAQGILGYVVRWIDQGVGCSKVPDIDGVNLMEDRATLRISSQHIANWLVHGVCSKEQVRETLRRMAAVVDEQNASDPAYERMSDDPDSSIAFQAASALIFEGTTQPNGYTEPLLHRFRRQRKRQGSGRSA